MQRTLGRRGGTSTIDLKACSGGATRMWSRSKQIHGRTRTSNPALERHALYPVEQIARTLRRMLSALRKRVGDGCMLLRVLTLGLAMLLAACADLPSQPLSET